MFILLFILWIFATGSVLGWLFILLHPARPWDFWPVGDDEELPPDNAAQNFPPVAILVPARNEAESLPRTLPALLKQDYPGAFRIFLIDDRSSDGTGEIARKIAADLGQSERLDVMNGTPLPEGWVGKMWALHQAAGRALAWQVTDGGTGRRDGAEQIDGVNGRTGEGATPAANPQFEIRNEKSDCAAYVLLTDADIFHAPQSLRRLISESAAAKLGLNSRMARLRCESAAEKLLIPAFVYFFNLLYPMRQINDPSHKMAGAAGGCVLLSRGALESLGGGLEPIRKEIIDDVNLGRQVKARGFPIRLSLSRSEVLSLREYPVLDDIWKMVTRTAFTELKYSLVRLTGAVFGLFLMFIAPVLAVIAGILAVASNAGPEFTTTGFLVALKGILALAIMKTVYTPAVRFFNLPSRYSWSMPIVGTLYGLMTIDSALRYFRGAGVQWRDAQTQNPKLKTQN